MHIAFTLITAQVLGSLATIVARAIAPDNLGPGDVFPDFAFYRPGDPLTFFQTPWFWLGLFSQLLICVGYFLFFRKVSPPLHCSCEHFLMFTGTTRKTLSICNIKTFLTSFPSRAKLLRVNIHRMFCGAHLVIDFYFFLQHLQLHLHFTSTLHSHVIIKANDNLRGSLGSIFSLNFFSFLFRM